MKQSELTGQTQFYSVMDGLRLMIVNDFDARMVCPNDVRDAWEFYAAGTDMGEPDRKLISRPEAEALSLKVCGKELGALGVPLFPPARSYLDQPCPTKPVRIDIIMDDSESERSGIERTLSQRHIPTA